jgi:hypothetical protein
VDPVFRVQAFVNPAVGPSEKALNAVLVVGAHAPPSSPPGAGVALTIVLDRSGSMMMHLGALRQALETLMNRLPESMVVSLIAFSDEAHVLVEAAPCSEPQRKAVMRAARLLDTGGGTRMSGAFDAAIRQLEPWSSMPCRILFLTDGRNEEPGGTLERVLDRCRERGIEVRAWGLGAAWDEQQLCAIAERTGGQAEAIFKSRDLATAFRRAFVELESGVARLVRLSLSMPPPFSLQSVSQVYPMVLELPSDPIALGSIEYGHSRCLLLDIDVSALERAQLLVLRPQLTWIGMDGREASESYALEATPVRRDANDVEHPVVRHYRTQQALVRMVWEARTAMSHGDEQKATRLLGAVLEQGQAAPPLVAMLKGLLSSDAQGTLVLRRDDESQLQRKTMALQLTTALHQAHLEAASA